MINLRRLIKIKAIYYFLGISFFPVSLYAFPPINLFRPSDYFLQPHYSEPFTWDITTSYEGSFRVRGFADDHDDCRQVSCEKSNDESSIDNVLQIYQREQNALAGFKGFISKSLPGEVAQLFNINDENGNQGLFIPKGQFKIKANLMFAARYNIDHGITFGLYLPVYDMELKNVRWRECVNKKVAEDKLENDFIDIINKAADLKLSDWKSTGIGDLLAQVYWTRDFPQAKPLLTNVQTQLRFGLSMPTGKKTDERLLLAIPFGNDGSWGLEFAGNLTLTFCNYLRGGIDADFLYLFGDTRNRRVKSNCNQTDLLFLRRVPAFREFGFSQQYNLYLETFNFCRGLTLKLYYQYLRRNEDKLFVCSDRLDPFVVNSAENLQEWTTHSLIFGANYDFGYDFSNWCVEPSILGWVKWGFNGKRSIVADTAGVSLNLNF